MYIHKIKAYLEVLFASDITKQQLRCLLATPNLRQLNGLCELLFNAFDTNGFKLSKERYMKIKRHHKILNVLCNSTKNSYQKRIKIIRQHLRVIINILSLLRVVVVKMLSEDSF